MNEIRVFGERTTRAYYDCEFVPVKKTVSAAALRRELTYKFGSLVIFSHGRVKYDLGSGTEQMLDRFCTSLVRGLICRSGVDMSRRREAMDRAVEIMGLTADAHSGRYDTSFAAETARLIAQLGKQGKNSHLSAEFMQTAYSMLKQVEDVLAKEFSGIGSVSLAVINELCAGSGIAPINPGWDQKSAVSNKRKSALEWILAAAVGFIMLPILL